jgi:endogenous inhibitor of DNA gyrase (YacG/DUF329 family)
MEWLFHLPLLLSSENLSKAATMKHNCPICRKPVDSASDADFPFCSERCRLLDLGNWAAEKYVVSQPLFDEEGDESPEPDRQKRNDEN